jgi:hypothetical protein
LIFAAIFAQSSLALFAVFLKNSLIFSIPSPTKLQVLDKNAHKYNSTKFKGRKCFFDIFLDFVRLAQF